VIPEHFDLRQPISIDRHASAMIVGLLKFFSSFLLDAQLRKYIIHDPMYQTTINVTTTMTILPIDLFIFLFGERPR